MITLGPKTAQRYLVGRTIVSVEVQVCKGQSGKNVHDVTKIVFDDGSAVLLNVHVLEDGNATEMLRLPPNP